MTPEATALRWERIDDLIARCATARVRVTRTRAEFQEAQAALDAVAVEILELIRDGATELEHDGLTASIEAITAIHRGDADRAATYAHASASAARASDDVFRTFGGRGRVRRYDEAYADATTDSVTPKATTNEPSHE